MGWPRFTPLRRAIESRWTATICLLLLAVMLLVGIGCEARATFSPSSFLDPDSVRYVNVPGTPGAVATVWSTGVVNVATGLHELASTTFPTRLCVIRGAVAWRGQLIGGGFAGTYATSWSPDSSTTFDGGTMIGVLDGDTMRVDCTVDATTPCGVTPLQTSLTLVEDH